MPYKERVERQKQYLGIHPQTAYQRLIKDCIFRFIEDQEITCYYCDQPMTRDTFTIAHKEAWYGKENAYELYFDSENVSYAHNSCNLREALDRRKTE